LLRHVPKERRALHTWRYVADQLEAAARGDVEAVHVSVALRMTLSMEHVQCLPA